MYLCDHVFWPGTCQSVKVLSDSVYLDCKDLEPKETAVHVVTNERFWQCWQLARQSSVCEPKRDQNSNQNDTTGIDRFW
jgi:hypothetical protein